MITTITFTRTGVDALRVAHLIAPSESRESRRRPVMQSACIDFKHSALVATDGNRMSVSPLRWYLDIDCGTHHGEGQLLIPFGLLEYVSKQRNAASARLEWDSDAQTVSVRIAGSVTTLPAVEGTYPDWRRIDNADATLEPVTAYGFMPVQIAEVEKIRKILCARSAVRFKFYGSSSPMRLEFDVPSVRSNGIVTHALVISPVRI